MPSPHICYCGSAERTEGGCGGRLSGSSRKQRHDIVLDVLLRLLLLRLRRWGCGRRGRMEIQGEEIL